MLSFHIEYIPCMVLLICLYLEQKRHAGEGCIIIGFNAVEANESEMKALHSRNT